MASSSGWRSARALINRPEVLLLDEPLGALDLKLRRQMQLELKRIQTEVGITFVHVTHDQEEAMTMADTIAVMNHGRVEQMGAPADLYENPMTTFVANFLGQSNLLTGSASPAQPATTCVVDVHGRTIALPADRVHADGQRGPRRRTPGEDPDRPRRTRPRRRAARTTLAGVVTDSSFTGVSTQYLVKLPWGQEVMVFAQNTSRARRIVAGRPGRHALGPGPHVRASTRPRTPTPASRSTTTRPCPTRWWPRCPAPLPPPSGWSPSRIRPPAAGSRAARRPTCCSRPACSGWSSSSSCPMIFLVSTVAADRQRRATATR